MNQLEMFWESIKKEEGVSLATSGKDGSVTIRIVSPVYYKDEILMFTDAFDEGVENGGRDCEFIILKPILIKGWKMENGIPSAAFEYRFDS